MGALKQIGDFTIVAKISESAITNVFKGLQKEPEQWVLIKALKAEHNLDEQLVRRLQDEAAMVSRVNHPNVVPLYAYGRHAHVSYLALEFVDGLDLQQFLAKQNLPPEIAWFILGETARGLKAAHDKKILHLDIKPSNIMISYDGLVKLTDFGMADFKERVESETGVAAKGTLQYFSPEQILGEPVAKRADIFSLGATFYEMLTGVPAFSGRDANETFQAILNDVPIPYLRKNADVPERLIQICEKMLAKNPSERIDDCDVLLTMLEDFQATHKFSVNADILAGFLHEPGRYKSQLSADTAALEKAPEKVKVRSFSRYVYTFLFVVLVVIGYLGLNSSQPDLPVSSTDPVSEFLTGETGDNQKFEGADAPIAADSVFEASVENSDITKSKVIQEGVTIAGEQGEIPAIPLAVEPGYLNLICVPWAHVFIDGDSVGTTPLQEPLKLLPGSHELLLANPGFPSQTVTVETKPGQTAAFDFSFWTTVGKLKLTVSPWAKVLIDHVYIDTVPPQKNPFIVWPGKHTLTLRHPVLGEWETDFEAEAGEILELQFNLRSLLLH